MLKIRREIEAQAPDIARILKGHLQTQAVTDARTGRKHDARSVITEVVMDGTEKTFDLGDEYRFTNLDSITVTVHPLSTVSMYGEMIGDTRFKIVAASSVSNIKVKVLIRGY